MAKVCGQLGKSKEAVTAVCGNNVRTPRVRVCVCVCTPKRRLRVHSPGIWPVFGLVDDSKFEGVA